MVTVGAGLDGGIGWVNEPKGNRSRPGGSYAFQSMLAMMLMATAAGCGSNRDAGGGDIVGTPLGGSSQTGSASSSGAGGTSAGSTGAGGRAGGNSGQSSDSNGGDTGVAGGKAASTGGAGGTGSGGSTAPVGTSGGEAGAGGTGASGSSSGSGGSSARTGGAGGIATGGSSGQVGSGGKAISTGGLGGTVTGGAGGTATGGSSGQAGSGGKVASTGGVGGIATGGRSSGAGGSATGGSSGAPNPNNPPVTPRWAFEPWVWEDNGNTRSSTESVVSGYLSRQIPVGGVIVDSPWETGYNTLVWDSSRYPNATDMITQFHGKGVKVITWTTAFVDTDTDIYQTAKQQGYGVANSQNFTWWKGTGIHIDITNPAAANWWNARMGAVLKGGVDGWKLDQGADSIGNPVNTAAGTLSVTDFKKRLSADFFDFSTATNPNSVVMVRPYDAEQGGVGSDPAKCSLGWVGDHDGGFGGIASQLSDIYTSAQVGFGAPGVEVGGYSGGAPSKNSLIRYAQFAAVTPLMENGGANGGLKEHLPWSGTRRPFDIYRYFATLHSELGSYMFSYSVEAHLTGTSILRATDKAAAQHKLGDQLFASVITSDVTSKTVNLPASDKWIDYWNEDVTYAAGSTTAYAAPLNQYPLFIRMGAVIPLDVKTAVTGHGDATSASKVTLAIYPSGQSSFVFHRPTGEGTACTDVTIVVDANAGTVQVNGSVAAAYRLRIKSLQAPTAVSGADTWSYDTLAKVVIVDKQSAAFTVMISGLKGY